MLLNRNRNIWFTLFCAIILSYNGQRAFAAINKNIGSVVQGNDSLSFISPLRLRGFSLLPAPQQVELGAKNIVVDGSWVIDSKIGKEDIAVRRLLEGASELHGLDFAKKGGKKITLAVKPGTVKATNDPALNEQAYLLAITANKIEITGNSPTGLFYGVQSLLQLLRRDQAGRLIAPEAVIRDWPAVQLRFVHWDTKHHQKRMETMKRLIDWHAFFKVNMVALEIEDKYEFPRHPIIGAPGAYTKAELQELTRYALERHIQIVPNIQAPAHMAHVLKHKEFEHLKAEPESNYQACMCDDEAINLIFDMYQDMIDATPGVDYFLASTDEVYYAGICAKCKRPYNPENRSLAWAEFAVKAHDWLAKRNRRMIAWVEYPLLPQDISRLPSDIINGIMGEDKEFLDNQRKIGMRQLAYSSIQGGEPLFSDYSRYPNYVSTVRDGIKAGANPIGSFAAAWDDSGLHEEVFHLGWATITQYAWNPYGPAYEQTMADFLDVFYGANSPDIASAYALLNEGAQFFRRGWDEVTSTERPSSYGNSFGKGIGTERMDDFLRLPEIPLDKNLKSNTKYTTDHSKIIAQAEELELKNDELINKLARYMTQVDRNRYSLEVYLSIAYLERYFIKTVLAFRDAERTFGRAQSASAAGKHEEAVGLLIEVSNKIGALDSWGKGMWENVTEVWEKSRYEKNRDVNGRKFVHVQDDVKDHFADRRKGLDYMIAPFQRTNLPGWQNKLNERIKQYAEANKVPVKGLAEKRLED
ncbi:beta-N-acetylhexosaminidase [Adhaeribacter swui]|uniref:beta-N-acetylhexosaminidase n=1 Tax=Adhaeribacter swui TaxID=2086471 RepID=A0A7G7G8M7_9BACT|nr:beta-N-acetylhexosaminidase [Adhaeribacter swui]QNF33511.1 beta-N-acetylhexosaminidase [Adhaeribacter swui]